MEDAFVLAADNNRRSQNSQRSVTRSQDGCKNSSESPSSRHDPRDGGGGKPPYKDGGKNHNDGNKEDFHTRDKRSHNEYAKADQQEQDSYNGAEEDDAFDPEEGRHHHNTRSTG
jgi:hypothetical protein